MNYSCDMYGALTKSRKVQAETPEAAALAFAKRELAQDDAEFAENGTIWTISVLEADSAVPNPKVFAVQWSDEGTTCEIVPPEV